MCLRPLSLAPLQTATSSLVREHEDTVHKYLHEVTAVRIPFLLIHAHTAPLYADDSPTAIPGEYVVILNEELSDSDGMENIGMLQQLLSAWFNSWQLHPNAM